MKESTTRAFVIIAVALLLSASVAAFSTDMKISANSALSSSTSVQTSSIYSTSSTPTTQTTSSRSSSISNSKTQTTFISSSTSTSSTSSTSTFSSRSTETFNSSITFSSPPAGARYMPGQNITISGSITPPPALPDRVLIQVGLTGETDLAAKTVAVKADGTFTSAVLIGVSWPAGTYTITATDSYGTTGTMNTTIYIRMY